MGFRLILSPCGTSLLTNKAEEEIRRLTVGFANAIEPVEGEEGEKLKKHIVERSDLLDSLPSSKAAKFSAEINGLFHLYGGDFSNASKDAHILLATDTWLGKETASAVGDWLKKQGIGHVEVWGDIAGLRTDSLDNFHSAITYLIRRLEEVIPRYKDAGYKVIFNLTGGFKSIQGVLQTLSQFYADEAVYIFEGGEELLRIPRIPVIIDAKSLVKKNLGVWRRLSLGLKVAGDECIDIPSAFIIELDNEAILSPWGELVWERCKKDIYEEDFWPPPSDAITFTKGFEKIARKLPKDRKYEINKRMDELVLHLEREDHPNPKSLNCHKLQGNPFPGCTHEIYAWSDKDARRIYGRCEGHREFHIIEADIHL